MQLQIHLNSNIFYYILYLNCVMLYIYTDAYIYIISMHIYMNNMLNKPGYKNYQADFLNRIPTEIRLLKDQQDKSDKGKK